MWARVVCGRKIGTYQEGEKECKEDKEILLKGIWARNWVLSSSSVGVALTQLCFSAACWGNHSVRFCVQRQKAAKQNEWSFHRGNSCCTSDHFSFYWWAEFCLLMESIWYILTVQENLCYSIRKLRLCPHLKSQGVSPLISAAAWFGPARQTSLHWGWVR